jgi:hypothetical protein
MKWLWKNKRHFAADVLLKLFLLPLALGALPTRNGTVQNNSSLAGALASIRPPYRRQLPMVQLRRGP